MLVDEKTLEIQAVLDWEFICAAPAYYSSSALSWLLLVGPETLLYRGWRTSAIEAEYERRTDLFPKVLTERKIAMGMAGDDDEQRLSSVMAASWRNGTFWFNVAVTMSWNVDGIFWAQIDRR